MAEKNLKPGWRRVKFGDVVRQVKTKADPETSGLERYIAGDHMDTDDLRIRRWGEIGSGYLGPAFHMHFKPGQVLYGSRRTYLRKVAVADFEGICANTTFILESKNDSELLPEFLPFLMQTDAFNDFSVKNSKGSVNPYINFSDLARFEFALPPMEEQRHLTLKVQAIDSLAEELQRAAQDGEQLVGSYLAYACGRTKCAETTLEKVSDLITDGDHNPPKRQAIGVPHLVVANITEVGDYSFEGCTFISPDDYERVRKRYTPREGDVIVTCVGSIGRVALVDHRTEFSADRSLAIVRTSPNSLLPKYAFYLMRSSLVQRQFAHSSIGTAQAHLYLKELRNVTIKVPSTSDQGTQLEVLREIDESIGAISARIKELKQLRAKVLASNRGQV
jgi:type I restriction enzyme S subunit